MTTPPARVVRTVGVERFRGSDLIILRKGTSEVLLNSIETTAEGTSVDADRGGDLRKALAFPPHPEDQKQIDRDALQPKAAE